MNTLQRKLRMGMVGGGQGAFIGAVHRMAATLDQQVELTAGCFSRDPENTRFTGAQLYLDPARCYKNYEEMAEAEAQLPAEKRIDFVSVVTPNVSHYPISRTFLDAGFHVVCDKPVTFSLEEAQKLKTLVDKTKLIFALTHNYTGHPMVRHARYLCRSKKLGTVRKVIVEYLQDWLMTSLEKQGQKQASWRTDPEQSGAGGALGDIGTHCVNLLEYVTGDPISELCADTGIFLPDRKLDEDANILLRLRGGGKGVLTISQIAAGEENGLKLRVYGSEGGLRWTQENPNYLNVYFPGKPRETHTRGAGYLSEAAASGTRIPPGHPEGYLEAFATIYVGAVEAIRRYLDNRPMKPEEYNFPTIEDGVRGMKFISKAVKSAQNGSIWIKM